MRTSQDSLVRTHARTHAHCLSACCHSLCACIISQRLTVSSDVILCSFKGSSDLCCIRPAAIWKHAGMRSQDHRHLYPFPRPQQVSPYRRLQAEARADIRHHHVRNRQTATIPFFADPPSPFPTPSQYSESSRAETNEVAECRRAQCNLRF